MAYKIIQEVVEADKTGLTAADVAVLLMVAWHAKEETRECFPGNPLLAGETGMTTRGVRLALAKLTSKDQPHQWLEAWYANQNKRILRVREDMPRGKHVPPESSPEGSTGRNDLPTKAEAVSALGGSTFRGEEAPSAQAEPRSTEPVSNQSENQSSEPVSEPGRDFVSHQGGVVVPLPVQPITSNKDVLAYLQKQITIACRDHDLPRPGGVNQAAALGRLKQIRAEGLSTDDLVELADLYVKAPTLWNPLTHPVMDFVTGTTQARLRNRRHEIRVTTSEPAPKPLRNERTLEAMRRLAEGSD